ncbi:MAG TPA: hypothetical protein VJ046_01330 [Candidatus Paceibacterota bacterium]|nr:hypothetical protein [Candidatus Paceibacterota bacterium]
MFNHKLRKKVYMLYLAGAFVVLVSGCASAPPTNEELANADYGLPISQQEAEEKACIFLKRYLKDPDSAKIEWGTVQTGWIREAPILGGQLRFGYLLTANVNAKNSFGGYTGYKPYQFLFFNGSIVSVYAQQELSGTPYMGKIY